MSSEYFFSLLFVLMFSNVFVKFIHDNILAGIEVRKELLMLIISILITLLSFYIPFTRGVYIG